MNRYLRHGGEAVRKMMSSESIKTFSERYDRDNNDRAKIKRLVDSHHQWLMQARGKEIDPTISVGRLMTSGADFANLFAHYTNLTEAQMTDCDFRLSDLMRSTFARADLKRSDFTGANLERVDFFGADLRGCILIGANLEGAYLKGARLDGADLTAARIGNAWIDPGALDTCASTLLITTEPSRRRRHLTRTRKSEYEAMEIRMRRKVMIDGGQT